MAMKKSTRERVGITILAWIVAFLIFFPILWTFLTSFKSELDAIAMPPKFLFFHWTLENYLEVQSRSNYLRFASNSIILSIGANIVGLIIAVPAAWSMAFAPGRWTKDLLMWMLSTKMMPAVGVLVPIYLIARTLHLLQGAPGRHPRGRAHGRRLAPQRDRLCADPDGGAGNRLDHAARDHSLVERSLLDPQPDHLGGGAADPVHRLLLGAGRVLLGQAFRRLHARHRADPHPRLVLAEAAGSRPDLRRRQMIPQ